MSEVKTTPFIPDAFDKLLLEHETRGTAATRHAVRHYAVEAVQTRNDRIGQLEDRVLDLESTLDAERDGEVRG